MNKQKNLLLPVFLLLSSDCTPQVEAPASCGLGTRPAQLPCTQSRSARCYCDLQGRNRDRALKAYIYLVVLSFVVLSVILNKILYLAELLLAESSLHSIHICPVLHSLDACFAGAYLCGVKKVHIFPQVVEVVIKRMIFLIVSPSMEDKKSEETIVMVTASHIHANLKAGITCKVCSQVQKKMIIKKPSPNSGL